MRGHHHPAGDGIGDLGPVILADYVQAEVNPRRRAGRGEDVPVIDIEHTRIQIHVGIPLGQLGPVWAQWVVALRPSRRPAAARIKAPVQTLMMRAPR